MSGPGVYVPDVTEGITRVEDLPQPRIKLRSRKEPSKNNLNNTVVLRHTICKCTLL